MKKIVINGGKPLVGTVPVSGSKNAALPILISTLVTGGVSRISGVPDIGDVRVVLELLECFGAHTERRGGVLTVDTRDLRYADPPDSLVTPIRASTYLIGAGLARFGVARIRPFGGCGFAARPIDIHLDACRALGCRITDGVITADRLRGGRIDLRLPSVGATVNSILMAVAANGESLIRGYAREPHVDDLIRFLTSAGASITETDGGLLVRPAPLHGARHHVVGDMIEAGSYLVAAAATDGRVTLSDPPTDSLDATLRALRSVGARISRDGDTLTAELPTAPRPASIVAKPYPHFPTDLAPIFSPLLSRAGGEIRDTVWPTRFGYLSELSRFGLVHTADGNRAAIRPSHLTPSTVTAPDLRGGMACVIAALMAKGKSEIYSADTVLRGYELLEEKLRVLGADVTVTDV